VTTNQPITFSAKHYNYKPMKFVLSFAVATQTEGCKFNLDLACSILELEFYNLNDGSKAY
jgi:hypothetical protein